MQSIKRNESVFKPIEQKSMTKSQEVFYKLLPKWKNHKAWDFIKADVYPKPEIRPGGNANDSI